MTTNTKNTGRIKMKDEIQIKAKIHRYFSITGFAISVLIIIIILDAFLEYSITSEIGLNSWKPDSLEELLLRALIIGLFGLVGFVLSVFGAIKSSGMFRTFAIISGLINFLATSFFLLPFIIGFIS
jgi:hypothetical protein